MSVDQQFNILYEKLQLLLKQHARLQKDHERLKEELHASRRTEQESHAQLQQLQEQNTILKISSSSLGEKDKKDFEKQINSYIREIDKCISFLSQ
jgi:hypothetical protein